VSDAHPWPFSAEGIDDPARGFALLRAEAPVVHVGSAGVWVATSHRAVTTLLRHEHCVTLSPPPPAADGSDRLGEPVRRTLGRMVLLTDPPDHRPRRLAVQRAFEPAVVERIRPSVRAVALSLLDELEPPADVVGGFARPLLDRVLDEALRLPAGSTARLRTAWEGVSAVVDDPDGVVSGEHTAVVLGVHQVLAAHLQAVRDAGPDPSGATSVDVLLDAAAEAGVSDAELVANLILVLSSGHRSATQALALAIRTLAHHPDQYARLRADRSLLPVAVEELLRWDSPVQFTNRLVTDDVVIDGCPVAAGSVVTVALGGANHDPEVFPDDTLDLGAARRPHLGFGRGAHYCAGAALARLVLAEALGAVAERLGRLSIAEPPTFTAARRGLDSLQVTW